MLVTRFDQSPGNMNGNCEIQCQIKYSITRIQRSPADQQYFHVIFVFSFKRAAVTLRQVSKIRGGTRGITNFKTGFSLRWFVLSRFYCIYIKYEIEHWTCYLHFDRGATIPNLSGSQVADSERLLDIGVSCGLNWRWTYHERGGVEGSASTPIKCLKSSMTSSSRDHEPRL